MYDIFYCVLQWFDMFYMLLYFITTLSKILTFYNLFLTYSSCGYKYENIIRICHVTPCSEILKQVLTWYNSVWDILTCSDMLKSDLAYSNMFFACSYMFLTLWNMRKWGWKRLRKRRQEYWEEEGRKWYERKVVEKWIYHDSPLPLSSPSSRSLSETLSSSSSSSSSSIS